jgi:hypothetical protein
VHVHVHVHAHSYPPSLSFNQGKRPHNIHQFLQVSINQSIMCGGVCSRQIVVQREFYKAQMKNKLSVEELVRVQLIRKAKVRPEITMHSHRHLHLHHHDDNGEHYSVGDPGWGSEGILR